MIVRLITCENKGNVIYLIGRDKDGDKVQVFIPDFRPYFFVPYDVDTTDKRFDSKYIREIGDDEYQTIDGAVVRKITVHTPRHVRKLRNKFDKTYEADVIYTTRFRTDKGIKDFFVVENGDWDRSGNNHFCRSSHEWIRGCKKPEDWDGYQSIMGLDIETTSLNVNNPDDIVSITVKLDGEFRTFSQFYSGDEGSDVVDKTRDTIFDSPWYIDIYDSEIEMLKSFAAYLRDVHPDYITGWNLRNFDIPYILNRMELLGLNSNVISVVNKSTYDKSRIPGVVTVDMQEVYGMIQAQASKYESLKGVSDQIGFNIPKHVRTKIPELWINGDIYEIIEYNCYDVEALFRIDEQYNLTNELKTRMREVGVRETKVGHPVSEHGTLALYMRSEREILPTGDSDDESINYKGGEVFEPKKGLYGV